MAHDPAWRSARVSFLAAVLLGLASTVTAAAQQGRPVASHAETQGDVTVRVAVPDAAANEKTFGVAVESAGVQPVWIEIENRGEDVLYYLPISTDPTYYAPLEVSWRFHERLRREADAARDKRFLDSQIALRIAPGGTESGYVFTHLETGLKFVTIVLLSGQEEQRFQFIVPVSGPQLAVQRLELDKIYPAEAIRDVDLDGLREALTDLPCCGSDSGGKGKADPLNIVLIGDEMSVVFPLVERGWRFVQPLDLRSAVDSARAFLFDANDPELPVSPMWVFGRREDAALEKPRDTISQRNHLRLWLAPLRYEGQSVFIGQISRDIGVEYTDKSWYLTTHKIDPQVDLDRDYLLQDLALSGSIARFGYVTGVGVSTMAAPHVNLVGDPYFTDGLRLVVSLGDVRPRFLPLDRLPWPEHP